MSRAAVSLWLTLRDFPRLGRVLEGPVVSLLGRRMLRVTYEAGTGRSVVVGPLEAADSRFAPRRMNCEPHDLLHRDLGSHVTVSSARDFKEVLVANRGASKRQIRSPQFSPMAMRQAIYGTGWDGPVVTDGALRVDSER